MAGESGVKGIKRPLFRVGQIYVRHGAKNEVASSPIVPLRALPKTVLWDV